MTPPKNLFIEGDNLEVLKLLQKAYYGKIKSTYIDPPYNTGKDFVYPDKFADLIQICLQYTDQLDDNDRKNSTNGETNGRHHSDWLSMMYPRLYLARQLLADNGVIFISIDDNEVRNLRHLLDEIFGEENFIAIFSWHSKFSPSNNVKTVCRQHEYILCYAREINDFKIGLRSRTEKTDAAYKNPNNDKRGVWVNAPLYAKSGREQDRYSITFPNGITLDFPVGRYPVFSKTKFLELYHDNRL